jgi:hypothetical protein
MLGLLRTGFSGRTEISYLRVFFTADIRKANEYGTVLPSDGQLILESALASISIRARDERYDVSHELLSGGVRRGTETAFFFRYLEALL